MPEATCLLAAGRHGPPPGTPVFSLPQRLGTQPKSGLSPGPLLRYKPAVDDALWDEGHQLVIDGEPAEGHQEVGNEFALWSPR